MAKFPGPPASDYLRRVKPDRRLLRPDTLIARIYARGGSHPTTWRAFRFDGPLASARFDHHVADDRRGVLYAATDLRTCLAEVFQSSRVIDRFADDRCLAMLFERAEPALPAGPDLDIPLSHPGHLADVVRAAGSLGYLVR